MTDIIKEHISNDNSPNFSTFPIAYNDKIIEEDSKVSAPSEDAISEARDWVNFKQS